ncbi:RNA polymerase sigma-70 factor [Pinibacter aurantiacus]|uniref:RNA polymerase sigma-70 factor n=1 Tax=Pinibacter aurantiacus TaxID=2851599 RepID=A0A9E2S7B4_9BACT|nr:RNA polymerase sigma-70 factor [Pinibacter aurantiacus]MBV4357531.1 RNA polymerase sigma-70 factor [Pinibacter aurantiacus]
MKYSALTDQQLLTLLKEANKDAFAEIYNRYWNNLYWSAYKIIKNESVAQDAVQEVFIALWQRNAEVDIQTLNAYLHQAVRFQILKAIKKQKADEQFYSRLVNITANIVYENPLLFKEQESLLKDILDTLPEDCRLIFHMSREEQMTYKQIALQLNISEKTVEKKMTFCLKHFRQVLQENKHILMMVVLVISLAK